MAITEKVWKLNKESKAFMQIKEEGAFMIGSPTKYVKVDKSGTVIYGALSIAAGDENIKTGGGFVRMPDMVQMIPETQVTPGTHIKVPSGPIQIGFRLAEDVGFFAALIM